MLAAAVLLVVLPISLNAQIPPGVSPSTTAIPVEFGYIDSASGNLHLELAVASSTQRASRPYTATIVYDSLMWQPKNGVWSATSVGTFVHTINNAAGWRVVSSNDRGFITYTVTHRTCSFGGTSYPYSTFSNFVWMASDGSTKSFAGTTTRNSNSSKCGPQPVPSTNGMAKDASGFLMQVTNYYSAKILRPDGTVWGNLNELPDVTGFDTNGNNYSSTGSTSPVVDTLGRTPVTITSTCNGNANQVCFDAPNSQGGTSRTTVTTESISVSTNFQQGVITECSPCTITVVQSIALADGTSYTFNYDSGTTPGNYGELTGITLLTGGQINYGYTTFQDVCTSAARNRWVNSRTTGGGAWTYSPQVTISGTCGAGGTAQQQVTVTSPTNDNTVYTFPRLGTNGAPILTQVQSYSGTVSAGNLISTLGINWITTGTRFLLHTAIQPNSNRSNAGWNKHQPYGSIRVRQRQ